MLYMDGMGPGVYSFIQKIHCINPAHLVTSTRSLPDPPQGAEGPALPYLEHSIMVILGAPQKKGLITKGVHGT